MSFVATSAGIGAATAFLLTRRSLFLVLSPVVTFVPTWVARKLAGETAAIEQGHPLFLAAASLKLWHMTLTGEIEAEIGRVTASASPYEPFDDELPRPNMVTDHTLH